MGNSVININDADFETEVLKSERPVLVYFWASWCGPCRLMSPLINLAATTYSDRLKIVKIEADPNPLAVKEYHVEGLPALRLLKGKEVLESTEGVIGKDKLLSLLNNHLPSN